MSLLSQDARMGRLSTVLGKDVLVLQRFAGSEKLNDLFDFTVDCLASTAEIDFDALIGTHATVSLVTHDGEERPFDGIITTKYANEGAMMSTGMPIVAVQDPKDNWVNLKVKETELGEYKVGEKVTLQGRNKDLKIQGTIVDISKKPNFATFRATSERGDASDIIAFNVKIQTDSDKVRPGMRFKLASKEG